MVIHSGSEVKTKVNMGIPEFLIVMFLRPNHGKLIFYFSKISFIVVCEWSICTAADADDAPTAPTLHHPALILAGVCERNTSTARPSTAPTPTSSSARPEVSSKFRLRLSPSSTRVFSCAPLPWRIELWFITHV